MSPLANGKIQGLFKAFECFSSTFRGKFYFQGLVNKVMYIQVLFKPVRTLLTHKAPPMSCSRHQSQTLPLKKKQNNESMSFHENLLLAIEIRVTFFQFKKNPSTK